MYYQQHWLLKTICASIEIDIITKSGTYPKHTMIVSYVSDIQPVYTGASVALIMCEVWPLQ